MTLLKDGLSLEVHRPQDLVNVYSDSFAASFSHTNSERQVGPFSHQVMLMSIAIVNWSASGWSTLCELKENKLSASELGK